MEMKSYISTVKDTPIFRGLGEEFVRGALMREGARYARFTAGENLHANGHALGILLSGKVRVTKDAGGKQVLMSVLDGVNIIGAAQLFCEDGDAVTQVTAVRECEVIFIEQETLEELMRENYDFARNYICYLTGRIRFLTGRIASIASPGVREKLLNYLMQNTVAGICNVKHGYTALAEALSVSRASLYRVMDEMQNDGIIERTGKKIIYNERF